jgi:hypothetical protein
MSVLLASSVLPTLREESNHSKKSNLTNLKNLISEKKVNFDSFFPDQRFATPRKIFVVTRDWSCYYSYSTTAYNLDPSEENEK